MTKTQIIIGLAASLVLTLPAFGDIVTIDFGGQGTQGTLVVSNSTASANVTGNDIRIDTLTYVRTTNDGTSVIASGQWSVTGTCGGYGCLDFSNTGNTFTISGAVTGLGLSNGILASGQMPTGTWDLKLQSQPGGTVKRTVEFNGASDSKSLDLLRALHLPTNLSFAYAGTSASAAVPMRTLSSHTISTDITNTATVPEPGSITLLSTLLLGCTLSLACVVKRA
jgi:hypothetical protein